MDRKSFIKSCRRKGYKYAETARFLGVSRQRVEQILRPIKQKARQEVQRAGLKNKPCEYPDCKETKTEAHHFDYLKPLDIHWLCIKHHKVFHRKDKVKKKRVRKCSGCLKELVHNQLKWCSDCSRKFRNKRHRIAYNTNPIQKAKQKELNKKWQLNNPEAYKKIVNKAVKKYNIKNRDKINLTAKENYWNHHEEAKAYLREFQKKKYHIDIEKSREKGRAKYQKNRVQILERAKEKYKQKILLLNQAL